MDRRRFLELAAAAGLGAVAAPGDLLAQFRVLAQFRPQVLAQRGVERREGLVEQEDRRVRSQGASEGDALLLAS
jgi:hypothetical protein